MELGKATRNLHTIQPSTTNNSEKDNKSVILSPRDRITLNQIAASITSLDGRGARKTSFSVKKGAKVPKKSPNRGHRPNSLVPKILIHENKAGDFSETSSESSASNSRNSIVRILSLHDCIFVCSLYTQLEVKTIGHINFALTSAFILPSLVSDSFPTLTISCLNLPPIHFLFLSYIFLPPIYFSFFMIGSNSTCTTLKSS